MDPHCKSCPRYFILLQRDCRNVCDFWTQDKLKQWIPYKLHPLPVEILHFKTGRTSCLTLAWCLLQRSAARRLMPPTWQYLYRFRLLACVRNWWRRQSESLRSWDGGLSVKLRIVRWLWWRDVKTISSRSLIESSIAYNPSYFSAHGKTFWLTFSCRLLRSRGLYTRSKVCHHSVLLNGLCARARGGVLQAPRQERDNNPIASSLWTI